MQCQSRLGGGFFISLLDVSLKGLSMEWLLSRHYEQTLPKSGSSNAAVLDICSSWISHYPVDYKLDRVAGIASSSHSLQCDT